jgi:hypothetical protein
MGSKGTSEQRQLQATNIRLKSLQLFELGELSKKIETIAAETNDSIRTK